MIFRKENENDFDVRFGQYLLDWEEVSYRTHTTERDCVSSDSSN